MISTKKSGITLSSLVLYVVLFTTFTIFVSSISSNMNERLFNNRGEAINYTSLNKLQYNLENSALNSNDVLVTQTEVSYSNGDVYTFDSANKLILKNGGILCMNVESFITTFDTQKTAKKVTLQVKFSKYLNSMTKVIVSTVEV